MKYGNRNRRFGWVWLAVGVIFGLVLQIKLVSDPSYAAKFSDELRALWRSAHAHANVLALANLLYAIYIDKAALSDGAKNVGSWLMILGALLLPLGLFFAPVVQPLGGLGLLGSLSTITAVIIIAIGHVNAKETS